LDGINYQNSATFYNVSSGAYLVYVRDQYQCGEDTDEIVVLNYPTFFTPNDDTYNDVWKITNIEYFSNTTIRIYDRFGRLLKQIAPQNGWDGIYNGTKLPSDDYWFVLEGPNGKTITGHFTLKR
jgi:gliding motility-associated-like protein